MWRLYPHKMSDTAAGPLVNDRLVAESLVLCVAGARPNFMKVKPVLDALEGRQIRCELVHTGQHYDTAMSDVFFDELGIRAPDHHLEVGPGSQGRQTSMIIERFEALVESRRPRAVLVVGDVNSTVACSLVAAKAGAFVVHVESGLRSRDWSMPEEVNRVVTDRLSDLLLAPSPDAVENLLGEGYSAERIRLVGNVMIDTLRSNLERAKARRVPERLGVRPRGYALATLHRPSNVDDPLQLAELLSALGQIGERLPVIFPVHPRTRSRLDGLLVPPSVILTEPMGYLDFVGVEAAAAVVITDSGGVQEETTALGVPCVTARSSTERPITVTEGTNRLAGANALDVLRVTLEVLDRPPSPRCPQLWDGRASLRCADAVAELLESKSWPRPTE